MPDWGSIFGQNGAGGQLLIWQVGGQVIQTLLAPALTEAQQELWEAAVNASGGTVRVVLTPAQLADMVVRGFKTADGAASDAAKSGVSGGDFQSMVFAAADAPSPGELAEALRRGLIPEDSTDPNSVSFGIGIREGRLGNKWTAMVKGLSQIYPTPTDALEAYLEGQVDEPTAQELYQRFGGDPEYFQLLYNTRGNAPTPTEALEMVRRGLIPVDGTGPQATTFQQAFLEGPWRNKWMTPFEGLLAYLPPPRTITALERSGVITQAQAVDLYKKQGLSPELSAAYSASATTQKTTPHKQLTEANITNLYEGKLLTRAQAVPMLVNLGYDATEAGLVLDLADHNVNTKTVNLAVSKVRTLYTGRRITAVGARKALVDLGLPSGQADALMAVWDLEAQANIKDLTPAQVADAWEYKVMTQDEAQSNLEALGYTPYDAWVLLSIKNKAALPNPPAKGAGSLPVVV